MSHTSRQTDKLIARVRRIKGQLACIDLALYSVAPFFYVLRQLASFRCAVSGLTALVMVAHLRAPFLAAATDMARDQGGAHLLAQAGGVVRLL